jgi:glutamine synthetase
MDWKKENNVEFIDLKVIDIYGKLHHVVLPGERLNKSLFEDGIGFDASNFGYSNIEKSDMIMIPEEETAFIDPFYDRKTLSFLCNVIKIKDNEPYSDYPRSLLKKALTLLKNLNFSDIMLGPELEFHIFEKIQYNSVVNSSGYFLDVKEGYWNSDLDSSNIIKKKMGYHAPLPEDTFANFRNEAAFMMKEIGIPVKYHHHEVSTAQQEFELNFQPALKSADSIILSKYILHNLANKLGMNVTFMPKPLTGEAGNGMHIHQYIIDERGDNRFSGDVYSGLNKMALWYIGGILKHSVSGSLLAFTNPTTNSYKRLIPGYEAPVGAIFGKSNRSAAVRIPGYVKDPQKSRLEFRTIDATCNPYYAIASMLMAGLDGITKNIDTEEEGYGPFEKNLYECSDSIKTFPSDLKEVLEGLKTDSDYLKPIFSDNLIQKWISLKEKEIRRIEEIPHPIEFEMYFDL